MGWPDAGESLGPGFNGSLELIAAICALLLQEHTDVREVFLGHRLGEDCAICKAPLFVGRAQRLLRGMERQQRIFALST